MTWRIIRSLFYLYHPVEFRERMSFRQPDEKIRPKDKTEDLHREEKTRSFRKNDKVPTRWPIGGRRRTIAARQDNRAFRRKAKILIKQGRYDEVLTQEDPVDTWSWD